MPIQTTDTDSLTFTAANEQWIVKAGVIIAKTTDNSDAVTMGAAGGQLLNHGDISSTGGGVFGSHGVLVNSNGHGALIFNGATGSIIGQEAVMTRANDTHVINDGTIVGVSFGIHLNLFTERGEIHNNGYIYGRLAGIMGDTVTSPKVVNSGTIESDGVGVDIKLIGGTATIINSGSIIGASSGVTSINFGGTILKNTGTISGGVNLNSIDPDTVINNGLIEGNIQFSGGADNYNGRKGVVDGDVFGLSGEDTIRGGGADDDFFGGDGRDTLFGRGDDDTLTGGDRADRLKGGGGSDTFRYEDDKDSQGGFLAETRRDTILDFRSSQDDRIDLRPIDAKLGGDDQRFKFIGTADFSGHKGELRYFVNSGDAYVQADVNGNGNADTEIRINDVSALKAADFFL